MTDTAALVDLIRLPMPLDDALRLLDEKNQAHGGDCQIETSGGYWLLYLPGPICRCHACLDRDDAAFARLSTVGSDWPPGLFRGMVLCPDCGNKRCPKATHHDNPCTHSNAPGQVGSVYGRPDGDHRCETCHGPTVAGVCIRDARRIPDPSTPGADTGVAARGRTSPTRARTESGTNRGPGGEPSSRPGVEADTKFDGMVDTLRGEHEVRGDWNHDPRASLTGDD